MRIFVSVLLISFTMQLATAQAETPSGFDQWLDKTAIEARDRGISNKTIEAAFDNLEPDPRVISFDRKQPEFVQTFEEYLAARVTDYRISKAREFFTGERTLLDQIADQYEVDPQFLIAFWGLESSFGRYQGKYSVIRSLATLGYDPRRSAFFTGELFDALRILDEGHVTLANFVGGWAGAMGQNQFIPSSFLNYAADFDGDGKKNIWSSRADVWASIANYLSKNGWKRNAGWGTHVVLPGDMVVDELPKSNPGTRCRALRYHTAKVPLSRWNTVGVKTDESMNDAQSYALIVPQEQTGTSYLVGGNFRTILSYNCANKYAVSVGLLADLIVK